MKTRTLLIIIGLLVTAAQHGLADDGLPSVYNVRTHGAVGDGQTLDSPAINAAIEACATAGGGTIYFPPGTYLSGSIRLKNNVNLHIDMGATLLAAPIDKDYYDIPDDNPWYSPVEYQDFGHSFWKCSLIWGIGLDNIAISGLGRIDGTAMSCGEVVRKGGGDKILGLKRCKNITIKDLTLINGGHFAMLLTGCDNVTIDGLKIDTNRDGINLDCCKNVRLANCTVNSPGDDAICLKSSYALGELRPTEDVTITNCLVSGFRKTKNKTDENAMLDGVYEGMGFGRIKFGTESNGGFKNITISNCLLRNCMGISLQSNDGGPIENINISNIVMRHVLGGPVSIEITSRGRGPNSPPTGTARNITIANIIAYDSIIGSCINGTTTNPIENVSISNIQSISHGGGKKIDKELNDELKEPWQGLQWDLPSYGLFCRHVKGLSLNNIRLETINPDTRPALVFDDVRQLDLTAVKAQRWEGNEAPVVFRNTIEDLFLSNCPDLPQAAAQVEKLTLSKTKITAGQAFQAACTVSVQQEGICTATLYVDAEPVATQYLWLNKNQTADLTFDNVKIDTPGKHKIHLGDSAKPVYIRVSPAKTG